MRPASQGGVVMSNMQQFGELRPGTRVLLGPGPSDVDPRVLRAMATPVIGHLDPDFLRIMDETRELIRSAFQTGNELTVAMSGPGSAGMEIGRASCRGRR